MVNCYQQHVNWQHIEMGPERARQVEHIRWFSLQNEPFIDETRTITAGKGPEGLRIFDFTSHLRALAGVVTLGGGPHEGGVHVRLSDEITDHPETTEVVLAEGVEMRDDGTAPGAWWACLSAEDGGRRYGLLHMTPPDNPAGRPVYTVRRYGRVGAWFEQEFGGGRPFEVRCRIVLAERALDRESCERMYGQYVRGTR